MITLGNILFFVIGVVVGESIIYGLDVYMDWKEDSENEQTHRKEA